MIIELPIYYTFERKTKKDKTVLIGLNWYRNAHFIQQNLVKHYIADITKKQLEGVSESDWQQFEVEYSLYYKNVVSDPLNIISILDKFMVDALVENSIAVKDTVKNYIQGGWAIGGQDKDNPRLVADVRQI